MANILIVDDSPVDRMLLRNYAEKIPGCSVIEAENGKDALAKMNEWEIDLVVTDLQMPQIDGLELVALVREKYLDLPVIVATAHGSESIGVPGAKHWCIRLYFKIGYAGFNCSNDQKCFVASEFATAATRT